MRIFFALDIGEEIRTALHGIQHDLRQAMANVRWVKTSNIHLTLKFLGEVPERSLDPLVSCMAKVAENQIPFILRVQGLGVFPNRSVIRIIWAGVERHRQLLLLQEFLEGELVGLGFRAEERAYHPHLTLGRVRNPRKDEKFKALLQAREKTEIGSFSVAEVQLMLSTLSPSGARYRRLASSLLGS